MPFELVSPFSPRGDQPRAIDELAAGLAHGAKYQTLLGATGTGKTLTMAHVIARHGRPALVMSHNKTLAAQLYGELKQFFPQERRRVLHLLLRLLPARGVRPLDGHLHREGLARSTRTSSGCACGPPRRLMERDDVIIVSSVSGHLRAGRPAGVPRSRCSRWRWGRRSSARRSWARW